MYQPLHIWSEFISHSRIAHSMCYYLLCSCCWPSSEGWLLYQDIPLWCHTSRSVLDCLPYCLPLAWHFKLTCSFHCSIVHSAQHHESRGTFCTKGDCLCYGRMSWGILCPRAICPGGGVGHSTWGGNPALKTEINLCLCISMTCAN